MSPDALDTRNELAEALERALHDCYDLSRRDRRLAMAAGLVTGDLESKLIDGTFDLTPSSRGAREAADRV